MIFLLILMLQAMVYWWYWWVIPSVMLGLVSWTTRSWLPVVIDVPMVLIVTVAMTLDMLGRDLR